MKRVLQVASVLLVFVSGMAARADTADFKGTWEGTALHEGTSIPLALEVTEAGASGVHGRLFRDGQEMAPLSEGKVEGNHLTFRADTLECVATLERDALNMTITVSHGHTVDVTMHRKTATANPPAKAPASVAQAATGTASPPPAASSALPAMTAYPKEATVTTVASWQEPIS
jgi:hypothetical protein